MPKRYLFVLAALAGVASLGACQDEPQDVAEMPSVPAAFPELLFPAGGVLKERAGSEDALQLVFHAPGSPEQVAGAYRARLGSAPWRIISDTRSGESTIIYAESNGRPVWIRLAPEPDVGTRVELNGAVLVRTDSARADSAVRDSAPARQPGVER